MNHRRETNPGFEPIYYEGEEIEQCDLAFTKQPLEVAIDSYFDYQTPMVIRKEEGERKNKEKAEQARKNMEKVNKAKGVPIGPNNPPKPTVPRIAKSREAGHYDDGGWNKDTRADPFFDPLKKNELFQYKRGNPESTSQKATAKPVPKAIPRPNEVTTNPAETYYDIADVEKLVSKGHQDQLKAIVKTNEMKLKVLEDQLKRDQKLTEQQNKEYLDKAQQLMSQNKQTDEFIKKMKVKNDQQLRSNGFAVPQANPVVVQNQRKSELHPIMDPKVKSSGYKPGSKKSKKKRPISLNRQKPSLANTQQTDYFDGGRETGTAWKDQLELLSEGYKHNLGEDLPSREGPRVSFDPALKTGATWQRPVTTDAEASEDEHRRPNSAAGRVRESTDYSKQFSILKNRPPSNVGTVARGNHLGDVDRLERQLNAIRNELKPVLQQVGQTSYAQGPTAELLQASVGRLMKIHSEKLTNMLIDDLLVETVAVLNEKEEQEERKAREADVRNLAMAMCEELNKIDVDQRFLFESKVNSPANVYRGDMARNLGSNQLQPGSRTNLNYIHNVTNEDEGLKLRDLDLQDLRRYDKMNMLLGKGPYNTSFAPNTKLFLSQDLLVKTIRDQILNEDKLNSIPFLRRKNQEGLVSESDKILNEVFNEIFEEFERIQEDFVKEVIKDELQP